MAPDRQPCTPPKPPYRYILPYPETQLRGSNISHETPRERRNRRRRENYANSIQQLRSSEEGCNRVTASMRIKRQVSRSKTKAAEETLAHNRQIELGLSVKARYRL
jgi:hypothetical protein